MKIASAFDLPPADLDGARHSAMLAHDMRCALQGVIGGVAQIESMGLSDEVREQFDRVAAAAQALAGLISASLGEDADVDAEPRSEINLLFGRLRRRFAGEAHLKRLELEIKATADLPPALRIEPVKLERLLCNLLANSIRHSESGAVRLSALRDADGRVAFHLTDDGPGIDEGSIDDAFGDRPVSLPRSGHGLGLHIVKQLSDEIGAEIRVANRRGGGATVTLQLPASLVIEEALQTPDSSSLTGIRVLLAEDNPTNQMVAAQMLRALGAEVVVCSDGIEALERFERESYDIVVVDIEMPRLSGLDVIRAIRARGDARAAVPIVALTAYALREHRDRISEAGANGMLSKPITSLDSLRQGLAAHLAPPPASASIVTGSGSDSVDLAIYEALCAAIGPDLMSELLEKVVADLLSARDNMVAALRPLDRDPIRAASHILISVAGAIGATRLQHCASSLNSAAHSQDVATVESELLACLAELDVAVGFVRDQSEKS